ncbi:hypothetical protein RSAG8_04523, partial [Rhizoctonia solani AG-8 WAC10335]
MCGATSFFQGGLKLCSFRDFKLGFYVLLSYCRVFRFVLALGIYTLLFCMCNE